MFSRTLQNYFVYILAYSSKCEFPNQCILSMNKLVQFQYYSKRHTKISSRYAVRETNSNNPCSQIVFPAQINSYRKEISENEEVHYEIWKQRRINYIEEKPIANNNEILTDPETDLERERTVPKVMLDLFNNRNLDHHHWN